VNRRDLPIVVVDLRHTGELVAHPCVCSQKHCTLGEHIWRSTSDMQPGGVRAQTTDPKIRAWPTDTDDDSDNQSSPDLHAKYLQLLTAAQHAARDLARFIDAYRPDRTIAVKDLPRSDNDWCRVCLAHGICSPRYRGDLCRDCYSFDSVYHFDRPPELVIAKHEGRRITEPMVLEAVLRARKNRRRNRRRSA
jgi:hypothetical protein